MRSRAIQIAAALEVLWAVLVVYEVHRFGGFGDGWRAEVLNVMGSWADPAIAIVVVTWLGDIAAATFTEG